MEPSYEENERNCESTERRELDCFDQYDPEDFSKRWKTLKKSIRFEYHVSTALSMEQCHSYFVSKRFHVVASGITRDLEMKFFLVAKKKGEICLSQVTIDLSTMKATLYLKSQDHSDLFLFTDAISMKKLLSPKTTNHNYGR